MKKIIILCLFIILITISFILFNNRTISIITLDINPSIEIKLNKKGKVKSIIPLNEDAKDIINDIKSETLENALDKISRQIIEKGYIKDNYVVVLLNATGNIKSSDVESKIINSFAKKEIDTKVITIDKITKEDEELAKQYNISLSKASYINTILDENNQIDVDNLVNKSVYDLDETKNTGNYCMDGYILEGGWCLKERERFKATDGEVCPREYYEYNGNCYEEVPIEHTDKLYCRDGFELKDNSCIRTEAINAEPTKYTCTSGEESTRYKAGLTGEDAGNANEIICLDTTNATHPVSPCETHDGTEYTVAGGKCYWHRAPVIEAGCPGKILVNGMCWDDASNIYICEGYRDGKRYSSREEYCEHSIKYIEPTVTEYKCPDGYNLNGNKCLKDEMEEVLYELVCPSGYTQVNNDRCINYNNIVDKTNGFVCNTPDARLRGNDCIIYDMTPAEHSS